MAKYKIIYDREGCICAGACVIACEKFWKLDKEGKATINNKKAKKTAEREELEIDKKDLECNLNAAKVCPVNVIHIKNLENNEDLI